MLASKCLRLLVVWNTLMKLNNVNVLELHNIKWILRLKTTADLLFIQHILSVEVTKGFEESNTKQPEIRL